MPACCCCPLRLPSLYISECVLIYLEPSEAQQVLAAAAARTRKAGSSAAVVIYEQTRPDDAFGATMISNLEVGHTVQIFQAVLFLMVVSRAFSTWYAVARAEQ